MNPCSGKRSKNLTNELWLSMHFAQSFEAVDNVYESEIHVNNNFKFIHLEYFILGDEEIYLDFLHLGSPFICNFQLILNLFGSGAHANSVKFISK